MITPRIKNMVLIWGKRVVDISKDILVPYWVLPVNYFRFHFFFFVYFCAAVSSNNFSIKKWNIFLQLQSCCSICWLSNITQKSFVKTTSWSESITIHTTQKKRPKGHQKQFYFFIFFILVSVFYIHSPNENRMRIQI